MYKALKLVVRSMGNTLALLRCENTEAAKHYACIGNNGYKRFAPLILTLNLAASAPNVTCMLPSAINEDISIITSFFMVTTPLV